MDIKKYKAEILHLLEGIELQTPEKDSHDERYWQVMKKKKSFKEALDVVIKSTGVETLREYIVTGTLSIMGSELRLLAKTPENIQREMILRTLETKDYREVKKEFTERVEKLGLELEKQYPIKDKTLTVSVKEQISEIINIEPDIDDEKQPMTLVNRSRDNFFTRPKSTGFQANTRKTK